MIKGALSTQMTALGEPIHNKERQYGKQSLMKVEGSFLAMSSLENSTYAHSSQTLETRMGNLPYFIRGQFTLGPDLYRGSQAFVVHFGLHRPDRFGFKFKPSLPRPLQRLRYGHESNNEKWTKEQA